MLYSWSIFSDWSAISLSTKIRPQNSQTIIFLWMRMSNWRWGEILLKQPPQASLSILTTANPFLILVRIRVKAVNNRGSIFSSKCFAFSNNNTSSFFVSAMMSFNSLSLVFSSLWRIFNSFSSCVISSFFSEIFELNSFIFFSQSCISKFWYSISLFKA